MKRSLVMPKIIRTILWVAIAALLAPVSLAAAPKAVSNAKSFILKEGADLWSLKGDKMEWVEKLSLGQSVVIGGASKGKYKDQEYSLAKVELDSGKSGYVIETYVAKDATMGVVTSDLATLYSEARDAAVLQTILPVGNVVALWPVNGNADFYKIAGWEDVKNFAFKDRFIGAADVSVQDRDINAALLLKAMAGMKRPEQRKKILNTIDNKYANSAFAAQVEKARQAIDSPQPAADPASSGAQTTRADESWVAIDTLNIRKEPSVTADIIAVLGKGDACSTSEYANDVVTVGGKSGRWYKTVQPTAGWVFGAFLKATAPN
jgi:hypothetical protein